MQKQTMTWIVLAVIMTSVLGLGQGEELDKFSTKAWSSSRKAIAKALELEDEKMRLPEKRWLGRDKGDAESDIDDILDDVLDVMEFSALGSSRDDYDELREKIIKSNLDISRLGEDLIGAKSGSTLNPYSRESIQASIKDLKKDIADYNSDQRKIVSQMKAQYKEMGVDISEQQVRFFLSSVSGDDIINLSAVFHNIQQITEQLQNMSQQLPGDTETVKRYYGMYVIMVKTLMAAHDSFLTDVDGLYLPRLEDLEEQNGSAAEETSRLLSQEGSAERMAILMASEETQKVTAEALELYRQHLDDMKARVGEGQDSMYDKYKVALNTYNTIKVAADLANIMKASIQEINNLQGMHLPDLIPIESDAVQRKFDEITNSIEK